MQTTVRRAIVLGLAILFFIPAVAHAATVWYAAGSWDNKPLVYRGVRTWNYVMKDPVLYNKHVNSVYLQNYDSYYQSWYGYEVGWRWVAGQQPVWFGAVTDQYGVFEQVFGPQAATMNSNRLIVVIYGTTAKMVVDDTEITHDSNAMFAGGTGFTGAERHDDRETNYAHFWSLRRLPAGGEWENWSNQKVRTDISSPATVDPDYWVNRNGHTEVYVQHE